MGADIHRFRARTRQFMSRTPHLQPLALVLLLLFYPSISAASDDPRLDKAMQHMLSVISGYGMKDPDVLQAMSRVPRHEFVPEKNRRYSYQDTPLGIGYGQTISQPYIVAYMTELLDLDGHGLFIDSNDLEQGPVWAPEPLADDGILDCHIESPRQI